MASTHFPTYPYLIEAMAPQPAKIAEGKRPEDAAYPGIPGKGPLSDIRA